MCGSVVINSSRLDRISSEIGPFVRCVISVPPGGGGGGLARCSGPLLKPRGRFVPYLCVSQVHELDLEDDS